MDPVLAAEEALPWQRLDRRMLLIYPVKEAIRLLPFLVLTVLIGTATGASYYSLYAFALVVPAAALRYLTTQYRIGPLHVQLRRGLLRRRLLSVPLARVRSVEVDADALHRILHISLLRIGTGQPAAHGDGGRSGFELDGLDATAAAELRDAVLSAARGRAPHAQGPVASEQMEGAVDLARWSARWVRFAPFSLMGVVALAAMAGAMGPTATRVLRSDAPGEAYRWASHANPLEVIATVGVVSLAVSSVLAVFGYLLAYARFQLLDTGPVLYVESGLLKRTQRSYDRARLRGASLQDPLLLRLVGGAKTIAIMTGVRRRRLTGDAILLPQSPARHARRVLAQVLPSLPTGTALRSHGAAATRRRYFRALVPVAGLAVALTVLHVVVPGWPRWTWAIMAALAAAMLAVAVDRARSLGHATPPGWLITRSGSLNRSQDHLVANGIVGWTVRQTIFQRRAGLATIIAATPAGNGRYDVHDLPVEQAWGLIERVTPGAGDIWVRG
ncbi:PH domain-containing protein [Tomitella biformata]|uniref:PH domain-containing protein n=1 Tax=Tomitella biformata TaxID=630403 RepID=UPI001F1F5450|nr:PH domain-containing protein [Tomitella biformata]